MQTISLSELKSDFDKALQHCQNEPVLINEQGKMVSVLLSFDEFVKSFRQSENSATIKKSDFAGGLAQFANPDLIPKEEQAVEMAIRKKYGID